MFDSRYSSSFKLSTAMIVGNAVTVANVLKSAFLFMQHCTWLNLNSSKWRKVYQLINDIPMMHETQTKNFCFELDNHVKDKNEPSNGGNISKTTNSLSNQKNKIKIEIVSIIML